MSKRLIIKLLAAATVFSVVLATAASLGTITDGKVGASSTTVSSCETDGVSTSYTTTWDTTDKRYEVSSVTVSSLTAGNCTGKTVKVSLLDSTDAQIGSGTSAALVATDTSTTVTMSPQASAEAAVKVHITI